MPLFSSDERYTPQGTYIAGEMWQALQPIFQRHTATGVSIRELGHLAILTAIELESCEILGIREINEPK